MLKPEITKSVILTINESPAGRESLDPELAGWTKINIHLPTKV